MKTDVVIVGAGLAGIVAALELRKKNIEVTLIDSSLPQANGQIGGFAKFSGAKFSLPPAGMGLLEVAKNKDDLWDAIKKASDYLGISLQNHVASLDVKVEGVVENLRKYESILYSQIEIDDMLNLLSHKLELAGVTSLKGKCTKIRKFRDDFTVNIETSALNFNVNCKSVFYAGGRLGTALLDDLGVEQTNSKGLDVGIRVEFEDVESLTKLRQLGPDAKIIKDNSRTFCLNVPGEIYRYPYKNISVPGGVVSEGGSSNVGILHRCVEKNAFLEEIVNRSMKIETKELEKKYTVQGDMLGHSKEVLNFIFGEEITLKLEKFGDYLGNAGYIDWSGEHHIHLPLIDWHWPTYSIKDSFMTNIPGLFCLGDSSGHARGLLQAAVSGVLASREY